MLLANCQGWHHESETRSSIEIRSKIRNYVLSFVQPERRLLQLPYEVQRVHFDDVSYMIHRAKYILLLKIMIQENRNCTKLC